MDRDCRCKTSSHDAKLVALTGGPGAGKTAVLEVVSRTFCPHVTVLPEAASIVFGGGFPRRTTTSFRRAAQRAIFQVQRELEDATIEERAAAVVLCDRGLLDSVAYWPEEPASLWARVGLTEEQALARYCAVIHLATPDESRGYNHQNPLRIETAAEARRLDERIREVWSKHPRRVVIPSTDDFIVKVQRALAVIRAEVPRCCVPSEELTELPI